MSMNRERWICKFAVALIAIILSAGAIPATAATLGFQITQNNQVIAKADLANAEIASAAAVQRNGTYGVEVKLIPSAASEFGRLTRDNVGRMLRIVIDDNIVAEPIIREAILGGEIWISGNFTQDTAEQLARRLK